MKKFFKYKIIRMIICLFNFKKDNKISVNNILIIRLDEIGDVVMTTPFIRELKRNFPKANITLIVKPQIYNLVELC